MHYDSIIKVERSKKIIFFCCNPGFNYPRKVVDSFFDAHENKEDCGITKDLIFMWLSPL